MRALRPFYSSTGVVSLFLTYVTLISLCFPFSTSRTEAASLKASFAKGRGIISSSSPYSSSPGIQRSDEREGELLVRFRQGSSEEEKTSAVLSRGGHRRARLRGESNIEKLEIPRGQTPEAMAAQLLTDPTVEFAEPNFLIHHDEITPNDPRFGEQWALQNTGQQGGAYGADIGVAEGWKVTTGDYSTVIAVIDSGIDFAHPDLKASEWTNQGAGSGSDLHGWDYIADSGEIKDENGHGTSIAGIIAAQGNNDTGITGVMWRASLMSLRVLDKTGTGDVAHAVEAIDYAVAHGAKVINLSWGTDGYSAALKDAIERASRGGAVVVCSAGNDGRDIESTPYYPASFDSQNIIAVASTDASDQLAGWSNYGVHHIAVAAPGVNILTTQAGGDYQTVSGTSASAPLVTGVVGLIKTAHPYLNARSTIAAIVNGARQVQVLSGKVASGGIVSIGGALSSTHGQAGDNGGGPSASPSPGNGQGNGNGGQRGPLHEPKNEKGGGSRGTPSPEVKGAPGPNLPDLNQLRKQKSAVPQNAASTTIHANLLCADCGDRVSGGGPYPTNDRFFANARLRPINSTGNTGNGGGSYNNSVRLGSRNFSWNTPLVNLPGRAGMDLNISLTYNSLVWAKDTSINAIKFNADHGFPGPGFQLGFPILQQAFVDEFTGQWVYDMVTPAGGRVEFRPTSSPYIYESADSSYTQLDMSGSSPIVRTSDGTRLIFSFLLSTLNEYRCETIEDRNGNKISLSYDGNGHLLTVTDTLARVITFTYNADQNLDSITQPWTSINPATHPAWARFEYSSISFQPSFSGVSVNKPSGTTLTVLSKVKLWDDSYYTFEYNSYGQINMIRHWAADNHQLSYTSYALDSGPSLSDCPRVSERHDWAENWSGLNGVPSEAVTYYSVDPNGSWAEVESPDNSIYRETYATTGWQAGLTIRTDIYSADNLTTPKKTTTTAWTQDNVNVGYKINPRPYENNITDSSGSRRRMVMQYNAPFSFADGAACNLPTDIIEYAADAVTQLRKTHTDYRTDSLFLANRIIGLPAGKYVCEGSVGATPCGSNSGSALKSKTTYDYDWPQWPEHLQSTPTTPTQHDEDNYGPGMAAGRGNLVLEQHWDATDPNNYSKVQEYKWGYYTTGAMAFSRDPLSHQTNYEYTDSNGGSTFAYPTAITDPDQRWSANPLKTRMWYNYDFGGVTQVQGLPLQGYTQGPISTTAYDNVGRVILVTQQFIDPNGVNNSSYSHTRWVYSTSMTNVQTFTSLVTDSVETYSAQFFDGAGRVRAVSTEHPYSQGGYSGQYTIYDVMGRAVQISNPTEMISVWTPVGDDSAWVYTQQQYDWKGRPTVLTHPGDGYQQINSYGGCGCAGGEVMTAQDEAGRQRRLTMDVIGRLKLVEELNWNGSVYSTTQYDYNALNQLTHITQQGDRVRTFEYDGYGRLWRKTTPEQGALTYTYNADATPATIIDARGAQTTFTYNNSRHLLNDITYILPSPNLDNVASTPAVHYDYDSAGNRIYMSDGQGSVSYSYDQLSRLLSETRYFSALNRSYPMNYDYFPSGQLKSVTNPFGSSFTYGRDKAGRVNSMTGSGAVTAQSYISNVYYRAFGAAKQVAYGNSRTLSLNYDQRMRLTRWDIPSVLGYDYYYNDFNENTNRVTFASNRNGDSRLDHSYDYDSVGRLLISHTSSEARAHAGRGSFSGVYDGPYSQAYGYDAWGNLTHREGWGGENASYDLSFNSKNQRDGSAYDQAGNIINDGGQGFTYDITGQAVAASFNGLQMSYDGDGLRIKRVQDNNPTYYVRSSVLGGQALADLDANGNWQRGYVYIEGQLLAYQEGGQVRWVHSDPVTKAKRMTDTSGTVVMGAEFDPFGGQVNNSNWDLNSWMQPHKYTTYERDSNQSDDAMYRRYNRWWSRFDQPDSSGESYNLSAPQSLNRYAYTQNDPVNFVDPSGLLLAETGGMTCYIDGIQSSCGDAFHLFSIGAGDILPAGSYFHDGRWWVPTDGHNDPILAEQYNQYLRGLAYGALLDIFGLTESDGGRTDDCHYLADYADKAASESSTNMQFANALWERFVKDSAPISGSDPGPKYSEFRAGGFRGKFTDEHGSFNQVRHFVGGLTNAFWGAAPIATLALPASPLSYPLAFAAAVKTALKVANDREHPGESADRALNEYSVKLGVRLGFGFTSRNEIGAFIRKYICGDGL